MHDRAESEETDQSPLEAPPSCSTVKRLCGASKGEAGTYGVAREYRLRRCNQKGFLLGAEKLLSNDAFGFIL